MSTLCATPEEQRSEAALDPCQTFIQGLRDRRQSENSIRSSGFAFAHLKAFLSCSGMTLPDVTPDDLDRLGHSLVQKGLAVMTVHLILRHVRRLFHWLTETNRIFQDPGKGWSKPKAVRPLMTAPSVEQVLALLAQPDITTPRGIRDRAFLETAYSTGARLEELTQLSLRDLDLERGLMRVMGKGRKERMLPLGRESVSWLREYIGDARMKLAGDQAEDQGRLWLAKGGRPLSGRGIRWMLSRYARDAGLVSISPHALRRACATHMLRRGAHPVQIQHLLGHVDASTLNPYLRLTICDLQAVRSSRPKAAKRDHLPLISALLRSAPKRLELRRASFALRLS
jgi:integrase/recombinase XerD